MIENERRTKLRVFLRVGTFAIAIALSAVALIRILAVSRQIQFAQQQLESAQSAGEDLRRKNNQLLALGSLRDQHHAAATRNEDLVGRFYQLCREPNDLPQIKTDFIVREVETHDLRVKKFAFSVPEGGHTLKILVDRGMGGMGPKTSLTFPLLPSSGYFIRIHVGEEAETEKGQLFFELTSNNADFKPIREPLPIANAISESGTSSGQPDHLTTLSALRSQRRQLGRTRGEYENISYPNSVLDLSQVLGALEHGLDLASIVATSDKTLCTLRFSIVSNSQECVTAATAILGSARGRLRPYTGNGRFYLRPTN